MAEPVKIFLSYAHADKEGVLRIYQRLKDKGYQPWLDDEDIHGGEEWEPAINSAIRHTDFFLLCMSPHSIVRRGVLQKEIKIALDVRQERLETDIFLIPVWIQAGTPLPKEDMPERLGKLQWINLSELNGWDKLNASIQHQLKYAGRDIAVASASTAATPADDPVAAGVDAENLVIRVRDAVQAADVREVEAAGAAVVEALARRVHGFTAHQGSRVANLLWRKHLVKIIRPVSDAFIRGGIDVPPVRRVYADALLAKGWLSAALDAIAKAEQSANADRTERALVAEVRGRIETAIYLLDGSSAPADAADRLWRAVDTYADVYVSDPRRHLLHGARAAALMLHADRAGISRSSSVAPGDVAVNILNEIRDSEESGRFISHEECEAAIHATLVTVRHDHAAAWLQRYVTHAQVDLANLRTLDQQLSDVWQLEPQTAPGSMLMPVLNGHLETRSSSWVALDARADPAKTPAAEPSLERIFAGSEFRTLAWYERGLRCAHKVVRIETAKGAPLATGFLLPGRELHASFPDEPLVLTSAFVVTNDTKVKEQYAFSVPGPEDVRARFQGHGDLHELEVVWSSFEAATTILRFRSPVDPDGALEIAPHIPLIGAKAYIIGHPGGRDLEFSLSDNAILDSDERVVHYRTPTEGGSSGSPVFNGSWKVMAIHHGGGAALQRLHGTAGTYQANEGIRLDFISAMIGNENGAGLN